MKPQIGDIYVWNTACPWSDSDINAKYVRPAFRITALGERYADVFEVQDLEGGEPMALNLYWIETRMHKDEFLTAVHRVRD